MDLDQARAREAAIDMALAAVEMDEQAANASRRAAALRKIVSGYIDMYPEIRQAVEVAVGSVIEAETGEDRPRGAEAVRLILHDSPNEWFTVSELMPMLRDRGWLPESENPANAVRAALERLLAADDSDVQKGKIGASVVYSYRPDEERRTAYDDFGEEPF